MNSIIDADGIIFIALTVEFDPATYSVTEGGQAALELVLSGPADRDVTVEFTTVDDSAVCKCISPLFHKDALIC